MSLLRLGLLDSFRMAGHQKDQVIRGLGLSAPSTDLWEEQGGLEINLYKTLKQQTWGASGLAKVLEG